MDDASDGFSVTWRRSRSRRDAVGALDRFRETFVFPRWGLGSAFLCKTDRCRVSGPMMDRDRDRELTGVMLLLDDALAGGGRRRRAMVRGALAGVRTGRAADTIRERFRPGSRPSAASGGPR